MERIKISTKEQEVTETLLLNVDGKDQDIVFTLTTLDNFKKAVQLTIRAKDIYVEAGKKGKKEDPLELLQSFEQTAKIYNEVVQILLGEEGYSKLLSITGKALPYSASQPIILSLGEIYSKNFEKFTAECLSVEGKI